MSKRVTKFSTPGCRILYLIMGPQGPFAEDIPGATHYVAFGNELQFFRNSELLKIANFNHVFLITGIPSNA